MNACLRRSLLISAVVSLTACATIPNQDVPITKKTEKPVAKVFDEKPGDITFGHPDADLMYQILIAEISTQRGNPEIASKFYLAAAKTSKDPRVAARAVRIASFADQKDDALNAAKIWVESEPANQEAQRILGVLQLRNGNFDEAQNILIKLLKSDKDMIPRNILLTGALLQREASKAGGSQISKYLVDLYPEQAEAHYIHASLAMQNQEKEAALASITRTIELKPDWVEAVILYPRILLVNGKTEESLEFLSSYLKKHPAENTIRLNYARALVDARKLDDARSQFELLAVKTPRNQDVLFALAMLSMQSKDFDEAEGYLNQLNSLGKANPQVYFYLGQIEEQKERFQTAIGWYAKIRSSDYYIDSQLRISVILAKEKNIEEALDILHEITTNTPEEAREVTLFEGNLLRDFMHYDRAYEFYSQLLKKSPQDPEYLYFRALVAERLNKIDVVIRDLSYVIEKDPENAAALNALGYTLADRTDKLEESLKLIQRARDLEPEDAAIIDSLGWINFRLGNIEAALNFLSEAMEKIDDGEVSAHYGEVLWASGDKEKAIQVWKTAKEKFGDNEILMKTLERFGQ